MPLSIIVDQATGAQKRVNVGVNSVAVENANTEAYVAIAAFDAEPEHALWEWNPTTRAYDARQNTPAFVYSRTKLSKREFLNRVSKTTLGQINAIIITPITDPATQVPLIAQLMTMKDYLNAVDSVELDNADTITFCAGLVALGLKTEAQRIMLLTPSTVASE